MGHFLIVALFLFALPASAQVIELTGGSSTEYNASGGAISLYTPGLATQLAAGISKDTSCRCQHQFPMAGLEVHAGDEPVSLTAGDFRLACLSAESSLRGAEEARSHSLYGTRRHGLRGPFFYAQRATQFGAGFSTSFQVHSVELEQLRHCRGTAHLS